MVLELPMSPGGAEQKQVDRNSERLQGVTSGEQVVRQKHHRSCAYAEMSEDIRLGIHQRQGAFLPALGRSSDLLRGTTE